MQDFLQHKKFHGLDNIAKNTEGVERLFMESSNFSYSYLSPFSVGYY
ncbi:hypothetical protein SRB521_00977 [Intestinimonas butyriciproducens]|nr:hypothetical protein SRB521_00977 [Intestinimonas butyriciproducens]